MLPLPLIIVARRQYYILESRGGSPLDLSRVEMGQTGSDRVVLGLGRFGSGRIGYGRVGLSRAVWGRVGSLRVGSGQVGSRQVRPGRVGPGWV